VLVVLIAVVAFASLLRGRTAATEAALTAPAVPTTRVIRGSIELNVRTIGELRASRVRPLPAPAVGGVMRLVTIAETGTAVHAGETVMVFDPTEQEYTLEVSLSQLEEAGQEIAKIRADTDTQAAQDQVTLLSARFDVRRAEQAVISNPAFIPANDFAKRKLFLDEARKRLAQAEDDVKSRVANNRAALAVFEARRARFQLAADRARQNIDSLVVKSPIDGYVVVRDNRDANSSIAFSGLTLPPYRAGDNVQPGRPIVDIFDISTLEIRARINEQERDNVAPGQIAEVDSDSVAGAHMTARVAAVSGVAQPGGLFTDAAGPLKEFDVTLALDKGTERLRPGTTVHMVIAGSTVDNVLHVPRQAVFEKNGKPIVYLRVGDHFEAREIRPQHRTEARIALTGVDADTEVALINPDRVPAAPGKNGAATGGRQ
jgi:HlyD family secretion protein